MTIPSLLLLTACDTPESQVDLSGTGLAETGGEEDLGCSSNAECAAQEVCLPDGACAPAWGDERGAVGYELRFWLEVTECSTNELRMAAEREGELFYYSTYPVGCAGGAYDWTSQPFVTNFGGIGWDRIHVAAPYSYHQSWSFCWVEDRANPSTEDEACGSLSPAVLHAGEWADDTPYGRLHAEIVPVGFE